MAYTKLTLYLFSFLHRTMVFFFNQLGLRILCRHTSRSPISDANALSDHPLSHWRLTTLSSLVMMAMLIISAVGYHDSSAI